MQGLVGRRIVVGVGGSIAAFRACELIRRLRELGAQVRVAPTRAAQAFVTPLTWEALSGHPILSTSLDMEAGKIPHIEEAAAAACVVVAPASADLLARMAHGIADEAILSLLLSYRGPLLVAPAMETHMWEHPATQKNVSTLAERGAVLVGPDDGALASGRSGKGRLATVDALVEAVVAALQPHKDLLGKKVLITAGPTAEDIDPVRYLTNRSSGKMGVALARVAAQRGAHVLLVHGPMQAAVPALPNIHAFPVRSAAQMHTQTLAHLQGVGFAFLCAAVADATPKNPARNKLKKTKDDLRSIVLSPTQDILADVVHMRRKKKHRVVVVGFAAETDDVEGYARDKLARKGCDLVCANDVSEEGSGFDVDTNRMFLVTKDGGRWLQPLSKDVVAEEIISAAVLLAGPAKKSGRKTGRN